MIKTQFSSRTHTIPRFVEKILTQVEILYLYIHVHKSFGCCNNVFKANTVLGVQLRLKILIVNTLKPNVQILITGLNSNSDCFLSFFLSWVSKTQPNFVYYELVLLKFVTKIIEILC